MRIREATTEDLPVLRDLLLEAFNWTGEQRLTRAQLLTDPHAARYLAGWMRPGDFGFVALDASSTDEPVLGAIWARPLPAVAAGYGYVDDDVPEVSMAVVAHARGRGIGGALLSVCLDAGRMRGWRARMACAESQRRGREHGRAAAVRASRVPSGRSQRRRRHHGGRSLSRVAVGARTRHRAPAAARARG